MRTILYCFCGLLLSCCGEVSSKADRIILNDTAKQVDSYTQKDIGRKTDILLSDSFILNSEPSPDINPEEPPHSPQGACSNCHK